MHVPGIVILLGRVHPGSVAIRAGAKADGRRALAHRTHRLCSLPDEARKQLAVGVIGWRFPFVCRVWASDK
jgi:hypothetical protein